MEGPPVRKDEIKGSGTKILEKLDRFVHLLKQKAKQLKGELYVLGLAVKDPRTPWYAKAFVALVVTYALSPLDLIPDFIPVLGYLDDLILIPAGIALAIKMIPPDVLKEWRDYAAANVPDKRRKSWVGAIIIFAIWMLAVYFVVKAFFNII